MPPEGPDVLTLAQAARLQAWLAGSPGLAPYASFETAKALTGGRSNITMRLRGPGTDVVLRRPPPGQLLATAHDMHREFRFLSALHGSPVPVPEPLAYCPDSDVIGAPFLLMRHVPGLTLHDAAAGSRLSPREAAQACDSLVTALVALHAEVPEEIGLGDLTRPGDYFQRQVTRWSKQWHAARTRDLAIADELSRQLLRARVRPRRVQAVVHGDYRFDNTLLRQGASTEVLAVLDWELAALGDPLADLATLCEYWSDPGDTDRMRIPVAAGVTAHDGFMTSDEVANAYARHSGEDLGDFSSYRALAAFRLGVILEGVLRRTRARHDGGMDDRDQLREAVPLLFERASTHLAGSALR